MTARNGGPSKPSKFLVTIQQPPAVQSQSMNRIRELTFQCEAAEMPGRTIETSEIQIAGPRFKLPYGTDYPDLTLTFLCTNDMYEKRIFDDWMEQINNRADFTFGYRSEYATTIAIFQYDEGSDGRPPMVTYGAVLRDAYPTAINAMPLAWAEDSVNRLGVTFTYTFYDPLGALSTPLPIPSLAGFTIGAFDSIANSFIGNLNGFVNSQVSGAFTGLSNFLGNLF